MNANRRRRRISVIDADFWRLHEFNVIECRSTSLSLMKIVIVRLKGFKVPFLSVYFTHVNYVERLKVVACSHSVALYHLYPA